MQFNNFRFSVYDLIKMTYFQFCFYSFEIKTCENQSFLKKTTKTIKNAGVLMKKGFLFCFEKEDFFLII